MSCTGNDEQAISDLIEGGLYFRKMEYIHGKIKAYEDSVNLSKEIFTILSEITRKEIREIGIRETARRINFSPSYISDIALGKRNVTVDIIRKLLGL